MAAMISRAGAPVNAWIDTFLGVLVSPRHTLKEIAAGASRDWGGLRGAIAAVVAASAVDGLMSAGARFGWSVPLLVAFGIVGGLFGWLLIAATVALPAAAFGADRARIRASFVTTAWALVPWIFMAPLFAYRQALGLIALPASLVPVAWVLALEWIAVQESYQLKGWQTLFLLVFLPQMLLITSLWWAVQVAGTGVSLLVG